MKRDILIVMMVLFALMPRAFGSSITIDLATMQPTTKLVDLNPSISTTESGDTLTVSLKFRYITLSTNEDGESLIILPGFTNNSTPGEPAFPIMNMNIRHRQGIAAHIEAESKSSVDLPIDMQKACQPIADDNSSIDSTKSSDYSQNSGNTMPENIILEYPSQYYRGNGFTPILICPVIYNQSAKIAKIHNEIVYHFIFNGDSQKSPAKEAIHSTTALAISADDTFFDNFTIGTEDSNPNRQKNNSGDINPQPTRKINSLANRRG